jgi:hypothetical protein
MSSIVSIEEPGCGRIPSASRPEAEKKVEELYTTDIHVAECLLAERNAVVEILGKQQEEHRALSAKFHTANEHVKTLKSRIAFKESELGSAQAEVDRLYGLLTPKEGKPSVLVAAMPDIVAKLKDANTKVAQLVADKTLLEAELAKAQQDLARAQEALAKAEGKIAKLKSKLQTERIQRREAEAEGKHAHRIGYASGVKAAREEEKPKYAPQVDLFSHEKPPPVEMQENFMASLRSADSPPPPSSLSKPPDTRHSTESTATSTPPPASPRDPEHPYYTQPNLEAEMKPVETKRGAPARSVLLKGSLPPTESSSPSTPPVADSKGEKTKSSKSNVFDRLYPKLPWQK